jgi:capsid protein
VAGPADVGPNYEAFQYRTLSRFCAAIGLPYSAVTGDMVRANYGNQRAAMLESRRRLEALQFGVIAFQLCRPVARRWLDAAVLSGALDLPKYTTDPKPFQNVNWIPPRWDWIDPLKDREAEVIAVNSGFKARSQVIEAEGYDAAEVDQRIAEDKEREKELGLIFIGSVSAKAQVAETPAPDPNAAPNPNDPNAPGAMFDRVFAKIEELKATKAPLPEINVTVPITLPRKSAEVTRVTKHDMQGRITEFVREETEE